MPSPREPVAQIVDRPPTILERLPAGPFGRLEPHLGQLTFETGVTFMREGDVTRFFAVVLAGSVALRMRVPERGGVTILTLEAGDIVGWSAIVPPYRATTSATTLEPTDLAILDAEALRDLLATDCEVAAAFLPPVLEAVADRLAATRDQLLDLYRASDVQPW